MGKREWADRDELSEDGKKLYDEMMGKDDNKSDIRKRALTYDEAFQDTPHREKVVTKTITKIIETDESQRLRLELMKLIQNSRFVIADCAILQAKFLKTEEYFKANEARVASICHTSLIKRLTRILEGLPAFEGEYKLIENTDSETNLFVR